MIFIDGWISIHRKIQEHWLYQENRVFSKYEAWIDLLLMASYKENKFQIGNELIQIEKGEFITSELKLIQKWRWSKSKVRAFLKLLENDSMIIKKTDTKKTTISIVNWAFYQEPTTTEEPEKDCEETTKELQKDTINKGNKVNKGNKENKKDIYSPAEPNITHEIIDYLNQVCGTSFKPMTKSTKEHINARLNEGYNLDDFKAVIDKKYLEWGKRPDMVQYLRPQTLFGTKFESYLNQPWTDGRKANPTDIAILSYLAESKAMKDVALIVNDSESEEDIF